MTDPFDALRDEPVPRRPRDRFVRDLRRRLIAELGVDDPASSTRTLDLGRRLPIADDTETSPNTAANPDTAASTARTQRTRSVTATPYLAASDAAAALDFYRLALGAQEVHRFVGDDGKIGHAEFTIGDATFYLSDSYPSVGAHSPADLGGSTMGIVLSVDSVDEMFAAAVAGGAQGTRPPTDEAHGTRSAWIVDPAGHRWNFTQPLDGGLDVDAYNEGDHGFEVVGATGAAPGGIWASLVFEDALAAIEMAVSVFGFTRRQVVTPPDRPEVVVHSELEWPEGGVVQMSTYDPASSDGAAKAPGYASLYVVTADPRAVWDRCLAAGLEVVREIAAPDYDDGEVFVVRDGSGNLWSFGSYAG